MLCGIPFIDSEVKLDLVVDHSSFVVGSISVLCVHGVLESF